MQSVKSDTYRDLNDAAKLYFQYVHISLLIYFEYLYTLMFYSNTNSYFFCFKQFLTLCFYFHEKIVGSVKDMAC